MQTLRDYQERAIRSTFDAWRDGVNRILQIAPTGSGKTTGFTWIAANVKVPVLILAHRRELVTQASNRLREFGVSFGVILAGEPSRPSARVQIASVQTLSRRTPPPAKLVICDEAHLSTASTWAKILEAYPTAKVLGCTATPWRLGGKPLAGAYDRVVVAATPSELREQGYLCDYSGFSYHAPDLSDVATVAGEYNEKQSSAAAMKPAIVANVVQQWLAHASELSTIVFAVTVEHSQKLTAEFRAAGVAAEHLDGTTPRHARAAILRRVEQGVTRVLCNVGVLIEGLDIPRLKCCVLARPTKSLARYLQMTGRVRRPWNGQRARIHDHAFLLAHGLPDDDRDYTLTAKLDKPPSLTRCEQCGSIYRGRSCPECGRAEPEPVVRREVATVDDAELFEFSSDTPTPAKPKPPVEVRWHERGRAVEGVYLGSYADTRPSAWGGDVPRKLYRLNGDRYAYVFPGTAELDRKMQSVQLLDRIRVTFLGDEAVGNHWRKKFLLERDDGT